jgi:putative peptidoglycan lipid II flippase
VSAHLRNISIVSAATMLSRILGLARDALTAGVFGTSALASAFYTAFTLPNLFRRLLGEGALTAAFVPTLNEELVRCQRTAAFTLLSQVTSWLLAVTLGLVTLAMVGLAVLPQVLGGTAEDGTTLGRWLLTAELALWLFPYLVFVCLAAAFSAALQTLQRFLEPALSPIWLNCSILGLLGGAAWLLGGPPEHLMRWLCAGVLLGGVFQMVVPALALVRLGWRPQLDLRAHPQVRAIARLMAPTIFGSAIYLINMAVSRLLGLSLDEASATLLNLAGRLMELPIGVFAVAVTTVVFPLISQHAARKDWASLGQAYRQGMRLILVVNIPAAAGLAVLAEPVIRLLFERGAFAAADTARMTPVLVAYALGLPFFAFVNLALRAFYAERDTVTPVRGALLSFGVNLGLSLALMRPLGTLGLAIAGNVAVVVQAAYLQRQLSLRRTELRFAPLLRDVGKIAGASAAMAAGVLLLRTGLRAVLPAGPAGDLALLIAAIPAGVVAYAAIVWVWRIEGREELTALIRRRLLRGGTGPAGGAGTS